MDFKKSMIDSVRREFLYNILIVFGIPTELVSLIKMFLNESYSRFREGKHLSDMFHVKNILKRKDPELPLISSFPLDYSIWRVQVKQDSLKLNGTHHL
jgi:hypothetical protein